MALLLAEGPATAASLSERLGLSPAAVRRHLDALVREGQAGPTPTRGHRVRSRGRPAQLYSLSDHGHERARHAYDDLAVTALQELARLGAITTLAQRRAENLRQRYAPVRDAAELAERLSADGYGATVHPLGAGTQLCQHHCPVSQAARQFPELCEAETAAFSSLLGTHVQRLATIAHGDGVCTTYLPGIPSGRTLRRVR